MSEFGDPPLAPALAPGVLSSGECGEGAAELRPGGEASPLPLYPRPAEAPDPARGSGGAGAGGSPWFWVLLGWL